MKAIPSVCCHDCGGSCPLNIYVEDGRITKIEARDVGLPAMRPCLRGLLYHYRVYAPDRLKYPMKRSGERGEGKFVRVSWDEALDEIAERITHIRDTYGPAAILSVSGSGSAGRLHSSAALSRFLNMAGGQTGYWNLRSQQGGIFASLATYGMINVGSDRADLLNSKMIILWGCNPAESVFGTETRWYLTQAKEKGIKIICVDPRFTNSCASWASSWIPIRPGTDAAMLAAMAYIILEQGLQNQHFLDTYTVGFDKFRDYVTGVEDGVAKTPEWAEGITGVPAETIKTLAWEYATTKPAAIIPSHAPGRTARGEQYHRIAATLSAMTGNIGISGGAAACLEESPSGPLPRETEPPREQPDDYDLPMPPNPVEKDQPLHEYAVKGIYRHTVDKIHFSKVWDAILRGKAGGYFSDYKMLYSAGGDSLNQSYEINRAVEAIKTLEFVVVNDQFMTPLARFADILLPVTTWCERNDIRLPDISGHYALYANKAIEPLYESKNDLDIFTELAAKMGISGYNDKTEDEWLRLFVAKHGIPDYDAFKASGFYKLETPEPYVAFQNQIKDPDHYPFPTPSGKIEIFSQRIADFNRPDVLPPIPKYVEGWEGPTDPKREQYPLQLITLHSRKRTHSQFHNIPWYRQLEPHEVWVNPIDAKPRDIKEHDQVKVFNDRGVISIQAKVTDRIMPGVVSIYQGAWYKPDPSGLDRGGCVNVLTRGEHSPGGAFCSNTALVQVEKI
ncbi:MAG TPA: molybdopterin-dependent oxidoreductase [Dehalococcoidales bacterium]|nr:molybdopterin-dependent oxidoreductase [Dehalococcoidales bacterium]